MMDPMHSVSAGTSGIDTLGGGGGLGNRVNAIVTATVLRSQLAAVKVSMQQQADHSGIGRILNVTI